MLRRHLSHRHCVSSSSVISSTLLLLSSAALASSTGSGASSTGSGFQQPRGDPRSIRAARLAAQRRMKDKARQHEADEREFSHELEQLSAEEMEIRRLAERETSQQAHARHDRMTADERIEEEMQAGHHIHRDEEDVERFMSDYNANKRRQQQQEEFQQQQQQQQQQHRHHAPPPEDNARHANMNLAESAFGMRRRTLEHEAAKNASSDGSGAIDVKPIRRWVRYRDSTELLPESKPHGKEFSEGTWFGYEEVKAPRGETLETRAERIDPAVEFFAEPEKYVGAYLRWKFARLKAKAMGKEPPATEEEMMMMTQEALAAQSPKKDVQQQQQKQAAAAAAAAAAGTATKQQQKRRSEFENELDAQFRQQEQQEQQEQQKPSEAEAEVDETSDADRKLQREMEIERRQLSEWKEGHDRWADYGGPAVRPLAPGMEGLRNVHTEAQEGPRHENIEDIESLSRGRHFSSEVHDQPQQQEPLRPVTSNEADVLASQGRLGPGPYYRPGYDSEVTPADQHSRNNYIIMRLVINGIFGALLLMWMLPS